MIILNACEVVSDIDGSIKLPMTSRDSYSTSNEVEQQEVCMH